MTATNLLTHLINRGVTLTSDGDNLRFRAPKGVLTADLRAELKVNKAQLLTLLASGEQQDPPPKPTKLFSRLLNDYILVAPDGYGFFPTDGTVVYTHSEIPLLKQLPHKSLGLLHYAKSLLPGAQVLSVQDSCEVMSHASSMGN